MITQQPTTAEAVDPVEDEQTAARRRRYVAGLRELADLIESSPIPVPYGSPRVSEYPDRVGDEVEVAEVHRVAALLGVEVTRTSVGHVHADYVTPSGARYEFIHVPVASRERCRAHLTYADNVQPDRPVVLDGDVVERAELAGLTADVVDGHIPAEGGPQIKAGWIHEDGTRGLECMCGTAFDNFPDPAELNQIFNSHVCTRQAVSA